jgi:ElaB/YqjD/DUF883 family membrane-anchored ribosome-binding protein
MKRESGQSRLRVPFRVPWANGQWRPQFHCVEKPTDRVGGRLAQRGCVGCDQELLFASAVFDTAALAQPAEKQMTDATKDWTGGESPRVAEDSTTPAEAGDRLVPDTGATTPPAAVSAGETKASAEGHSIAESTTDAISGAAKTAAKSAAGLASDADAALRKSLETIRAQADELRRQTSDWAGVRGDQARELVDERPLTVVAAAFGLGLIFGALISRS